jgi:hypothetical protein
VALYLASAKRAPQPREPEAHPTAAWVQVSRIGICVPGVVSPELPAAFARPVAYGDFITAILALLALAALGTRAGTVMTWVFNTFGTVDLLFGFYQGSRISLPDTPGLLGAGYFILAAYVPLLLITHGLAFRILLRTKIAAPFRSKLSTA